MNTIYFRHQIEDKRFQISFRYINEGFGIDRSFNLLRNDTENVDSCLDRIRANVEKEFVKKMKKNKKDQKKRQKNVKETESQQNSEEQQDSNLVWQNMSTSAIADSLFRFVLLFRYQLKWFGGMVSQ